MDKTRHKFLHLIEAGFFSPAPSRSNNATVQSTPPDIVVSQSYASGSSELVQDRDEDISRSLTFLPSPIFCCHT